MKSAIKKGGSSRCSRRPPARLSWPASLQDSANRRKKPRHSQDSELWVDKFAPSSSSDLCVAPKKVKECKTWLEEAIKSPLHHKLLVLVGTSGAGKSTMARVLARELGLSIHSWNESFVPRERGCVLDQVVSVEHTSALDSFEEFLSQCGAGFSPLQISTASSLHQQSNETRSLILLEDLPNLHGSDAALRFRSIVSRHLRGAQVPTVLIFSDVSEGMHKPADLERLIDPNDLYSPSTLVCQIHPVTKPRMKKVFERIAQRQRFLLSPSLLEEFHLQSGGDLRHAIMALQVRLSGYKGSVLASGAVQRNERDQKLSTFHALGKLLYGKRTLNEKGQECLAFDPEGILAQSDLGVAASLRFLEYHSPEFFTDIHDMGVAFAYFSDAAMLLDNPKFSYDSNALFPDQCASSIAGRAVANSNKHPAPNRFRQFTTPKVFDVIRKRRQNETLLSELAHRLSSSHLALSTAVGESHAFVTEMLPAMRMISPDVVNPSVENFYSVALESTTAKSKQGGTSKETASLEVQGEILEEDDIEDFDSDSEEETRKKEKKVTVAHGAEVVPLSQKENEPSSNIKQTCSTQKEDLGKPSPESNFLADKLITS